MIDMLAAQKHGKLVEPIRSGNVDFAGIDAIQGIDAVEAAQSRG